MDENKVCTKCNISRSLSEYHKDKSRVDNLTAQCKWCRNKKHQELRESPWYKEKEKAYRDKYRSSPVTKARELKIYREWCKNNKEYLKECRWYNHSKLWIPKDTSKYRSVLKKKQSILDMEEAFDIKHK